MNTGWWLPVIAAGLTILAFVGRGARGMWRTVRKAVRFIDDVTGTPGQPSLMDRISALEDGQQQLCRRMDMVTRLTPPIGTDPTPR